MGTMVLERKTLPEPLLSCFNVPRIKAIPRGGGVFLSPADDVDGPDAGYIDPADYDNDTDYINAIPGAAERLIKSMNAPASEFSPVPREWFNV